MALLDEVNADKEKKKQRKQKEEEREQERKEESEKEKEKESENENENENEKAKENGDQRKGVDRKSKRGNMTSSSNGHSKRRKVDEEGSDSVDTAGATDKHYHNNIDGEVATGSVDDNVNSVRKRGKNVVDNNNDDSAAADEDQDQIEEATNRDLSNSSDGSSKKEKMEMEESEENQAEEQEGEQGEEQEEQQQGAEEEEEEEDSDELEDVESEDPMTPVTALQGTFVCLFVCLFVVVFLCVAFLHTYTYTYAETAIRAIMRNGGSCTLDIILSELKVVRRYNLSRSENFTDKPFIHFCRKQRTSGWRTVLEEARICSKLPRL